MAMSLDQLVEQLQQLGHAYAEQQRRLEATETQLTLMQRSTQAPVVNLESGPASSTRRYLPKLPPPKNYSGSLSASPHNWLMEVENYMRAHTSMTDQDKLVFVGCLLKESALAAWQFAQVDSTRNPGR